MNEITKKELKEEALKRMHMYGLLPQIVTLFETEGRVMKSEIAGFLYELDKDEQRIVNEFESENGGLVYHVIRSDTGVGVLYSLLYVGTTAEEWEMDHEDIENGICLAYVYNQTVPEFSEYGSIGVRPMNGGIVRTA